MWIAIGLLAALVLLALFVIGTYNGLVGKRNRYKNAFAQIDVQLKRRYDLIPNLVETVKGYMKHEAETLEAVIKARNMAYTASQAAAQNPGDAERDEVAGERRRPALGRARPAARAERVVSGPQGQHQHARPERGADLDREQSRVRAPGLQRLGHRVQQRARGVPGRDVRRHVRLQPAPRCSKSIEAPEERKAPKVSF